MLVLVATQCDRASLRWVEAARGRALAAEWKCPFETSAKDDVNVRERVDSCQRA